MKLINFGLSNLRFEPYQIQKKIPVWCKQASNCWFFRGDKNLDIRID